MKIENLVIVLPAYEPNDLMINLIEKLNQYFEEFKIVIVNDGSKTADETFKKASLFDNVTIINHEVNKGKGAALKTAYKYIEDNFNKNVTIVTADADGQHRPEDICKVATLYNEIKDGVVLGSRQFENKVPLRSRFGNDATRVLYRLLNRKIITDNQTGLRAFGSSLLSFMQNIKGNRYEYEMNVLSECARQDILINETKIETVYINNNESSHFRPFRDFMKICKNMIKYALPSIITFILNILLFITFYFGFELLKIDKVSNVLFSTLSSHVLSIVFNVMMHYFGLFNGNKFLLKIKNKRRKYLLLGSLAILVNTATIMACYFALNNALGAKGLTESLLVVISIVISYIFVPRPSLK